MGVGSVFFFQAEDGIRDLVRSRGLGDVYKRQNQYPELEVAGEMRLVNLNTAKARTLVPDARPYGWGNRAAVWRSNSEVIYIDGQGRTQLLNVDSGKSSILSGEPQGMLAWLFDATLRSAVRGSPALPPFSPRWGRAE